MRTNDAMVDQVLASPALRAQVERIVAALRGDHGDNDRTTAKCTEYLVEATYEHVEALYGEGVCLRCGQVISKRVAIAGAVAKRVTILCPCDSVAQTAAALRDARWARAITTATSQHVIKAASPRSR